MSHEDALSQTDTRRPAPVEKPVALTVAGSDSGGGAGVQADLKTIEAHDVFGTSAVTAVTAQHTRGVESTHILPAAEVAAQIDAVADDFDVRAAKTGMLATAEIVDRVAGRAADAEFPVVVDPVMVATSGDRLLDAAAEERYEDLIAEAALVTPNADEAAVLTDVTVEGRESAIAAGEALLAMGADAALVTGGHLSDRSEGQAGTVEDVLVTPDGTRTLERPRVETAATHGSGCTLSAAVAARLARGESLPEAVETGAAFVARAVRYHLDVGEGPGAVHHAVGIRDRAAREPTAEAVREVVRAFVERDASALVPEVGMNVVGATPYAEETGDTAAVEGRITRTLSGVKPNRGVRFGASSHVARFLLSCREFDPDLRFAANCRFDADVADALDSLDWSVAEYDRGAEPEGVKAQEGSTMQWGARRAFESVAGTPVAVVDRGEVGKESMTKVVASDADELAERVLTLLSAM
ncbi:bifunctional hydroxymethylpyrimidine kinase/phosphomethylpyrimidine kinase [Halorussus gelatinilyticus]|uniref:Bifunctional hydroxymethylpyrimidine kinase/phosphomethylpyrimidine kinase n=1 Tax=Halorussus gelatinilyticus TaxID=2937524 RepID=A0A8U0INX8_9EURY|nr:bifunctional hydroxymethylpyrimidine kinase/phosphomethylpyrimidine kinase [Halorussus gelatinilyticus]UPW02162.1 bifunctional hydroxymethylpyrimidine kinase/phosphomethylpyrimidine kinase [Halorussus gelatinilyticus]